MEPGDGFAWTRAADVGLNGDRGRNQPAASEPARRRTTDAKLAAGLFPRPEAWLQRAQALVEARQGEVAARLAERRRAARRAARVAVWDREPDA